MRYRKNEIGLIKIVIIGIVIVSIYNIFIVNAFRILDKRGKPIFNFYMYIIITDSMKPYINSGDIIISHKEKEEKIEVGDVITFSKFGEVITHRIIEIKDDGKDLKQYITKGDNNNVEDNYNIYYDEIIGKEIIKIPYLGKIALILQEDVYIFVIIIILLTLYLHFQKNQEKKTLRREKKRKADEKFQKDI